MRTRNFRTSILAGAGAVALAAGVIVPGIASADSGSLGSLTGQPTATETGTKTFTEPGKYKIAATGYDNCTVKFELNSLYDEYVPNYRADYRVDAEDTVFNKVYRPVVGSNQVIVDAIKGRDNPYDIALETDTVDLTEARTVPSAADDSETTELAGVAPNEDGKHTVSFGVYQGPEGTSVSPERVEVQVTGCPTTGTGSMDFGSLDFGSLDLFGSLGSTEAEDKAAA